MYRQEDFTHIICDIMTPYCKGNQYSHSYDTVNKEKHNIHLFDNNKPDKPWFDDSLKHLYKDYKSALAVFNRCKSLYNHEVLRQTKQLYKDTETRSKRKYLQRQGLILCDMKRSNPKEFFGHFRKKKHKIPSSISMQDFYDHFRYMS